jgi:hypothetical protein
LSRKRFVTPISVIFFFIAATSSLMAAPITAVLEHKHDVLPGDTIQFSLKLFSDLALGGIDFTIHYDSSAMTFLSAEKDTGLPNWESFYTSNNLLQCNVGVTAIADISNGPIHPKPGDFYPYGPAVTFTFAMSSNWAPDSAASPVVFRWPICQANAVSNKEGDSLLIVDKIYDYNNNLFWVESDDVNYPDADRPDSVGLPDSCLTGTSGIYYAIDFRDGAVFAFLPCGDADGNTIVSISDVVYILAFVFAQGPAPDPDLGDADCNGFVNISDAVYLLSYIFGGGPAPCAACP